MYLFRNHIVHIYFFKQQQQQKVHSVELKVLDTKELLVEYTQKQVIGHGRYHNNFIIDQILFYYENLHYDATTKSSLV